MFPTPLTVRNSRRFLLSMGNGNRPTTFKPMSTSVRNGRQQIILSLVATLVFPVTETGLSRPPSPILLATNPFSTSIASPTSRYAPLAVLMTVPNGLHRCIIPHLLGKGTIPGLTLIKLTVPLPFGPSLGTNAKDKGSFRSLTLNVKDPFGPLWISTIKAIYRAKGRLLIPMTSLFVRKFVPSVVEPGRIPLSIGLTRGL